MSDLHIRKHGADEGPIALLLHSSGMNGRQWAGQFGALKKAGWRPWAVDFLGYGESPKGPDPFDHQFDVEAIVSILDSHPDETFALVGHSYGGVVTVQAALAAQNKPQSIFVYEPVCWGVIASDGTDEDKRIFDLFEDEGFLDDERGGSQAWMEQFVTWWSGEGAWEAMGERGQAMMMHNGRKTYEEVRSICVDRTPGSAYQALTCPTTIAYGTQSPKDSQTVCHIFKKHIKHAHMVPFEAGHMGPLTHRRGVARALVHHLSGES